MPATLQEQSTATAEFINPVLGAAHSVFEMMVGCVPRRKSLSIRDTTSAPYDVSAIIGVTGKRVGTIVMSLSEPAAIAVLERMTGNRAERVDPDVCDAVGELTNMIAGAAKAKLAELELSISIPNIVSGPAHTVHYPARVQPIAIEFESEIGPFCIDVGCQFLDRS
ncbi:chemotaxis protein CheX [Stratiformator vulcanicus]|uniref:CheY-P phosphatase CheX n=1 Tax=Stratiformator vulcanicus TaxID=2527980 RepID=A0A517R5A2_9PLAN|nr:chemotaxis protein CheX [Stratiformator vulcanicus]QDT39003.1 CheY-P phosphatase CheX [Stratiformator vulcanicus]